MEINYFLFHVPILCLMMIGDFTLAATIPSTGIDTRGVNVDYMISSLNRSSFPAAFVFGTASSAYQYEGAANEDGRGPSIWDTFTHRFPEKMADRSNGDVADDSYHKYKEDVKLMKDMEVDAYRFSISWPRILPHGKLSKGVNQKGIMYYHNLINELLANGIKPYVTIFHWDLPQALEDEYKGFLSPLIVDDYVDYANLCFKEFGDKVKHWMTFNEPWTYSIYGYDMGVFAPGRCSKWMKNNCTAGDSATEPYLVTHHQLLAHAAAVNLYRQKYLATQKGKIGIALVSHWFIPYTSARHDVKAAYTSLDFMLGWFLDPIYKGDYPSSMLSLVGKRLPKFSIEQSRMLKGSFDFVGINYYTSRYAIYAPDLRKSPPHWDSDQLVNLTGVRNGKLLGPQPASHEFYTYPKGLHDLLVHLKRAYSDPAIYITETGTDEASNDNWSLQEALDDKPRIKFYHDHLAYVQRAIREGVNVRGFFPWSLLDSLEWSAGYTVRFGINYVDRKHGLKRYPKLSAHWFKKFLHKGTP